MDTLNYHLDDTNIHTFTLLDGSFETVDTCLDQIGDLLADTPPDAVLRLLIDTTAAPLLPIAHAFRHAQMIAGKYMQRAAIRVAFVHAPACPVTLAEAFLRLVVNGGLDKWRFFADGGQAEARDWLLQT